MLENTSREKKMESKQLRMSYPALFEAESQCEESLLLTEICFQFSIGVFFFFFFYVNICLVGA